MKIQRLDSSFFLLFYKAPNQTMRYPPKMNMTCIGVYVSIDPFIIYLHAVVTIFVGFLSVLPSIVA